jgi:hypothetical protein
MEAILATKMWYASGSGKYGRSMFGASAGVELIMMFLWLVSDSMERVLVNDPGSIMHGRIGIIILVEVSRCVGKHTHIHIYA